MLETFAVCILTVDVKPKDAFCDFLFILILKKPRLLTHFNL